MKPDSHSPAAPVYTEPSRPVKQVQVLIFDDHPAIREALSLAIDREGEMKVVGGVGTIADARTLLEERSPDIFIMDLSPRVTDSLELVEHVRSSQPETRVLIYSTHNESVCAGRALRAGARGYVPKSAPTAVVVEAIRCIHQGEVYLNRQMTSRILGPAIRKGTYGVNPTEQLTDRELTVFRGLGAGKSVRDLAEQLDLSRKTVETYRRRAKEKLGYESVDDLLRFALEWEAKQERKHPDE